MKKGRRLFTPLDIVAPWLVCLGSAALCIWGAVVAPNIGARIASIAPGIFFLAFIPLWYVVRSKKTKVDFTTNHGIGCVWGKRNKPARITVEQWTDKIVQHWAMTAFPRGKKGAVLLSQEEVLSALKGTICFFVDDEKLSAFGRFVRGYTWGSNFVVGRRLDSIEQQGTTDYTYVRDLFDHEMGHIILGFNGEGWEEKKHHDIQAKVGSPFVVNDYLSKGV